MTVHILRNQKISLLTPPSLQSPVITPRLPKPAYLGQYNLIMDYTRPTLQFSWFKSIQGGGGDGYLQKLLRFSAITSNIQLWDAIIDFNCYITDPVESYYSQHCVIDTLKAARSEGHCSTF